MALRVIWVGTKLDDFEAVHEGGALAHILRKLDCHGDDALIVLLDRYLHICRAGLGRVASRPLLVDAAVVDDYDKAPERLLDRVRGLEVRSHILVATL